MSWTLDGFEKAVQDAMNQRFERDEFVRKARPECKAALIAAVQIFAKDTKEYWDRYCRIVSEKGYTYLAKSSYEHFNLNSTDTLHIMREDGNIRFWAKQKTSKFEPITIFDISLEGEKINSEFNSEINLPILYYWKDSINDDELRSKYLDRLLDRARGLKHEE